MTETEKLIEKEGVLGFQKNPNDFEPVTNFMVKVNGIIPKHEQRYVFLDNKDLEPLHKVTEIDNGEALKDLFLAEKELFWNNYAQVLLLHAASALAANYDVVVEEFLGCAIPVAIGEPVSGKSTALKAVLSVYGIMSYTNDCTKKFIEKKQCSTTIPFGWDDVSNIKTLGDVAVSSFN